MQSVPKISDAEWLVMKVLWGNAQATTNQVIEALASQTPWKPKTVMTLLNRLVKKGALGFEKKGRLYEYFPLVREQDCVREESRSFLERVYGGALTPMLAHFLEETPLKPDEIAELKRILDEKGK